MPRIARIDYEDSLHHVMGRGVNRLPIFMRNTDREEFLKRLEQVSIRSDLLIYAWCLMPNHFHLLVRRRSIELSLAMRRLLTGYAQWFNKKHDRVGHLFQNRYKDKIVQEDGYFLVLVRYIHANPVKANLVKLSSLESYPWTGHSTLVGGVDRSWQETDYVLSLFADDKRVARKKLISFMANIDADGDEVGEKWVTRFSSGSSESDIMVPILGQPEYIQRIIGSGNCIPKETSANDRYDTVKSAIPAIAHALGVSQNELRSSSRKRSVSLVRRVLSKALTDEYGLSYKKVGKELGMTPQAVYWARNKFTNSPEEEILFEKAVKLLSELL